MNSKLLSSRHGVVLVMLAAVFLLIHVWAYMSRPDISQPLYYAWPAIDIPVHMMFGAWLALFFLYTNVLRRTGLLFVFSVVMLVGLGWELLEYGFDIFYGLSQGFSPAHHGMADTYKDIVDNGVGATAAIYFFRFFI
ncbi:hypothetical protein A3D71_00610 [Candidatus Kaiserbacteria bacterium RIFCSPHIGHO2_02_FULL_55_20]|uniref:VanZ-like domain-containing protein n=1 Tax=Candidatus Kaiserbacteria bacterium RIFCSPHIGHO2_02_FULL_55_20 TaxID=1798497 RepID=A0A1F6DWR6_9BACT|nr:MAG: hypothetical protein A2680_00820 [Candidatus Kaiserbacteria bacterium RIFCSPHIGHO2_01_FULL_55_37]OGG65858.1 MAG: hypothetical protein A3D71_00610 [Candidatus Kaiserbacteria bacterium RIFCSPHIGHO2_02_FULL_55_20]